MGDFKMDVIKWLLNFVSCKFGLQSYLWFQIELAPRARSILKSRVRFQPKLHSTQFNYHYYQLVQTSACVHGDMKHFRSTEVWRARKTRKRLRLEQLQLLGRWTHSWRMNQLFYNIFNPMVKCCKRVNILSATPQRVDNSFFFYYFSLKGVPN